MATHASPLSPQVLSVRCAPFAFSSAIFRSMASSFCPCQYSTTVEDVNVFACACRRLFSKIKKHVFLKTHSFQNPDF
uniref:MobB-like protein n=1 Tax=Escherichia coli TaxID=562 RepID=A0A5B9SXN4_ECOLX|nr:mobB-like protein [Escherichia coli]